MTKLVAINAESETPVLCAAAMLEAAKEGEAQAVIGAVLGSDGVWRAFINTPRHEVLAHGAMLIHGWAERVVNEENP